MSYTAEEIRDMALERSDLNNSDLIPPSEVLQYITQAERKVFVRGARINPDYFGTKGYTTTRTSYAAEWNLSVGPGNVVAVTMLKVNAITGTVTGVSVGDRVNLIQITKPNLEVSPRAYLRGKKVHSYNDELGADNANMVTVLDVYYSPMPSKISNLTDSITLYDEWSDLLAIPLAMKYALRDTRLEEVQALHSEYQDTWGDFVEGIVAFDYGVNRSLINVPAIPNISPPQAQS